MEVERTKLSEWDAERVESWRLFVDYLASLRTPPPLHRQDAFWTFIRSDAANASRAHAPCDVDAPFLVIKGLVDVSVPALSQTPEQGFT